MARVWPWLVVGVLGVGVVGVIAVVVGGDDDGPVVGVAELQAELDRAGIQFFNAGELLRIRHKDIAASVGITADKFELPAEYVANMVGVARSADRLREALGEPVNVINGYRPREYDRLVTDAADSQHRRGLALDLVADDMDRLRLLALQMFDENELRGLGLYEGNIHIDLRPGKPHSWGSRLPQSTS